MAKITNDFINKLLKWEGGDIVTDDPLDFGGKTKYGVTTKTWEKMGYDKTGDGKVDGDDVPFIDKEDFKTVLKIGYWDQVRGDQIKSQSVAEFLCDWYWNSGVIAIKTIQKLLGLKEDGTIGKLTIEAINLKEPSALHSQLFLARIAFIDSIIRNSIAKIEKEKGRVLTEKEQLKLTQKRFERGWKNRILDYKFEN